MLITKLKYAWHWCKVNWKFILGITIPIILSILMRKNNQSKIFQKALEIRNKELEINNKASTQELKSKLSAQSEHHENVKNILEKHDENLKNIKEAENKRIEDINSAEKATEAIKNKLDIS